MKHLVDFKFKLHLRVSGETRAVYRIDDFLQKVFSSYDLYGHLRSSPVIPISSIQELFSGLPDNLRPSLDSDASKRLQDLEEMRVMSVRRSRPAFDYLIYTTIKPDGLLDAFGYLKVRLDGVLIINETEIEEIGNGYRYYKIKTDAELIEELRN